MRVRNREGLQAFGIGARQERYCCPRLDRRCLPFVVGASRTLAVQAELGIMREVGTELAKEGTEVAVQAVKIRVVFQRGGT